MKIESRGRLLYVSVELSHHGRELTLRNVVLDTASSGTAFAANALSGFLLPQPTDTFDQIRGVGGYEQVVRTHVDRVAVGELFVDDLAIEIAAMDYGFELDGIIGLNFLMATRAVIDLSRMSLEPG
jgi:hypothetical protein